jgi:hypothetical protein
VIMELLPKLRGANDDSGRYRHGST